MSALSLLAAGVRFIRVSPDEMRVKGPPDMPLLVDSLKAEVERRMPLLVDLDAAQRRVLAERRERGLPLVPFRAKGRRLDPSTGVIGDVWVDGENLPRGVCDTCGDPIPTLLASGKINLTCASGMCDLCCLVRKRVVARMREERRAA